MNRTNEHGQPIGEPVPGWTPRPRPGRQPIEGRWCRIEPLDPARHAGALSRAFAADADGRIWTYMGYGPFATAEDYRRWAEAAAPSEDPLFYAILDRRSGEACSATI